MVLKIISIADTETTLSAEIDEMDTTTDKSTTNQDSNDEAVVAVAESKPDEPTDGKLIFFLNDFVQNVIIQSFPDDVLDDLEQGKGVDEALSLLPDADREITEADKEKALQVEVEAAGASVVVEEEDDTLTSN